MIRKTVRKVEVLGYDDAEVSVNGLCIELKVQDDRTDKFTTVQLYPEESKALRKAMKLAEKVQAAA